MKLSIEVKDEKKTVIHSVDFEPVEKEVSSAVKSVASFLKNNLVKVTRETKESL